MAGEAPPPKHPVDALVELGRFREAAWILEHYLKEFPDDMPTVANLAMCYVNTMRGPAAVQLFKRAIEIEPNNPKLLHNLGRVGSDLGYHDDAIWALRRLIDLQPDAYDGHAFLGQSLRHLRRFQEAYAVYDHYPKDGVGIANIDSSRIVCAEMDEATSREHCISLRRKWYADHKMPWRFHHWPNALDPEKRLTIGYVSGDFRSHSVSLAFGPLITDLDRKQFKVVCLYTEDIHDPVTDRLKKAADKFLPVAQESYDGLARIAYQEGIDILVDLSGHTPGTRIRMFSAKPAPVQISMLGAIGATGVDDIDYVVADEGFVPPEEAARWPEKAWYVPSALHMRPDEALPDVAPSPVEKNGYVTFGCFHHFSKVTDAAMAVWGDILRQVPDAKLLIKDWVCDTEPGRARILQQTGLPAERILFAGPEIRPQHHLSHGRVDVLLDAWPQNGGVTTIEAVALGVPVLSLAGDRPNQRGGIAVARHLPEDVLVTCSVDEYREMAILLGRERHDWLIRERPRRRARWQASLLGDTPAWVRTMEQAYRDMWRRHCASAARSEHEEDAGRAGQRVASPDQESPGRSTQADRPAAPTGA